MMQENTDNSTDQDTDPPDSEVTLLSVVEARVLGALMEKQLTTPDAYPLTVNSLTTACNQKTSRDPVSNYQQGEIVHTLRQLETRHLINYEMGARSDRYGQSLTHELGLSKNQQALLCVMMLRGPQTINELHTRTQRMGEFTDQDDLVLSLERLTQGDNPHVTIIPHQSGKREDRYCHLLCGMPEMKSETPVPSSETKRDAVPDSQELNELRAALAVMRKELDHLYLLTGQHKPDS